MYILLKKHFVILKLILMKFITLLNLVRADTFQCFVNDHNHCNLVDNIHQDCKKHFEEEISLV
jgi:hypothetical protein